ncbi:MAG: DNA adenine methylase [Candidatus Micrarchaeota archaeon]|nr:DNA adenine methylase [Candidatus Micrarchaeota archaeon]
MRDIVMQICILGRNPSLGVAELESVLGPDPVKPLGGSCAMVSTDADLSKHGLGGTVKIGEVIGTCPLSSKLSSAALEVIVKHLEGKPAHKISFGLSVYGIKVAPKQVEKLAFDIKGELKKRGRLSHVVLGEDNELNSAQVIHNKMLGDTGFEFLIVSSAKANYIARTTNVQDIESYSRRDYKRPKRDTKVGMLPPKLAQIMLNLAKVGPDNTVLDPFCGTGVVLMEAALKGSKLIGSDLNPEMTLYTKDNLEWLASQYKIDIKLESLTSADASINKWKGYFDRVVSEIYLGPPLDHLPKESSLKAIAYNANIMLNNFLANLRPQLNQKSRCCIAIPVWKTKNGFLRLPVADKLDKVGYARVKFANLKVDRLIYHRPDQIVGRELLVLIPK